MSESDQQNAAKSATTASFVTALVLNSAVFAIEIGLFTLLRPYFKAIYEPRTYVPSPEKRVQPLSRHALLWPYYLFKADYKAVLSHNGLDAYFFVRFLRVFTITLIPIWLISWIILLPATSVNTSVEGLSGLDIFTFGNVESSKRIRYVAHLLCVYGFTFWIFHIIRREMAHFLLMRQRHLIEKTHAKSVQARTVLVTGIPKRYLTHEALYKLFNTLPGGVKKIWINRDLKDLPEVYDRRMELTSKLESAETTLIVKSVKNYLHSSHTSSKDNQDVEASPSDTSKEVPTLPEDKRPTHKLGFLGLFGKKVDTINWAREEIAECNRILEEGKKRIEGYDEVDFGGFVAENEESELGETDEGGTLTDEGAPNSGIAALNPIAVGKQAKNVVGQASKSAVKGVVESSKVIRQRITGHVVGSEEDYPRLNSAFVLFRKQIAAHVAAQVVAHHEPYRMTNRHIEVHPSDVIWANLNLNPYEMKIRMAISYSITAGLIILWTFPVAFIGSISNLSQICTRFSWLAWVCTLPPVVKGIIQGILPPVLLAVLMMLLPIILRLLARFEGIPKYTGLELSLMTRYFIFLFIQSFIVISLSSGIIASLESFSSNPGSIATVLAQNLPKASTFFLTFVLLQGLTGVAAGFLQIVALIVYYVKLFILGSTSRSIWTIKFIPGTVAWGTLFPNITLLVVITLGYSIISPIINGLALVTFFLFYQLYKYIFLYVYQQPSTSDTGGMFYPKALQHIFVGLYIQQIVLCALFFLSGGTIGKVLGVLMIVLIVVTAGFHAILNNSYNPLLYALPLSLQDRMYTQPIQPIHYGEPEHDTASSAKQPLTPRDNTRDEESAGHPRTGRAADDSRDEENDIEEEERNQEEGTKNARKTLTQQHDDEETYGFYHPAASRAQRTVWIPQDEFGVSRVEEKECKEAGVRVSTSNGYVKVVNRKKAKVKVDVTGGPPDLIGVVI